MLVQYPTVSDIQNTPQQFNVCRGSTTESHINGPPSHHHPNLQCHNRCCYKVQFQRSRKISRQRAERRAQRKTIESQVHVDRRRKQLLQPQQSRPNMHSQALWRRLGEDYKFRRKLISRLWLQNDKHQNSLERYFLRFMTYLHWPHKTHQRNMVCIT